MDKHSFIFLATIGVIITLAVGLFFYAKGYNYNNKTGALEKTGIIVVKSNPDAAAIYLNNGLFRSTSNTSITNLKSGLYNLRIEKEGYSPFQKDVPVKEEYVTEVTALLIPLSPELKPLTTTGVISPVLTSTRDKIIFLTKDRQKPGIWSLNLAGNLFSLFKGNIDVLVPDQSRAAFSIAEKIYLSPNDEEALVAMNKNGYYALNLTNITPVAQATASAQISFDNWAKITAEKNRNLLNRFKLPNTFTEIAADTSTLWSPDEKRFLYAIKNQDRLEYHVHDNNLPLGIGEKEDYGTVTIDKTTNSKVGWYSDSRHLIISTCEAETKNQICTSGNIRIVRIDGSNNTLVYSGALSSNDVFPTPDGSKIIILTAFNSNAPANLYAIILR